jgi:hypothetical protein
MRPDVQQALDASPATGFHDVGVEILSFGPHTPAELVATRAPGQYCRSNLQHMAFLTRSRACGNFEGVFSIHGIHAMTSMLSPEIINLSMRI